MILVTGGTGLVGAHLLYHLVKKHTTIVAIYRKDSDLEKVKNVFSYYDKNEVEKAFTKVLWKEADITDVFSLTEVFRDITYVYHCAAMVSFDAKDDAQMLRSNIDGTANIVNLSIENGIKKICYVSSIAAIGKRSGHQKIDETLEWNIENSNYGYAISKHGAEMEMWRASQEGIEVVIVNPGVILGSGFWQHGSGKLVTSIHKGLPFYTDGITGFIGVKDVVTLMIQLMESTICNERFILVSENVSFKNVLFSIAEFLGKKKPSIKVNRTVSAVFWRVEWLLKFFGRKPLVTRHSSRASHNKYYYSNEKIKKTLNYEFENIESVLQQVCADFKQDI